MEDFIKNNASKMKMQPKKETWEAIEKRLGNKRKRGFWILFSLLSMAGIGLTLAINGRQPASLATSGLDRQDTNTSVQGGSTGKSTQIEVAESVEVDVPKVHEVQKYKAEIREVKADDSGAKNQKNQVVKNENTESVVEKRAMVDEQEKSVLKKVEPKTVLVETNEVETNTADTTVPINVVEDAPQVLDTMQRIPPAPTKSTFVGVSRENKWEIYLLAGTGRTFYTSKHSTDIPVAPQSISTSAPTQLFNKSTDKSGLGVGFQLLAEKWLTKNVSIGSGINYTRFNWTTRVGNEKARIDAGQGQEFVVDTVFDNSGQEKVTLFPINPTSDAYVYGSDLTVKNSLSYIGIPLYVSAQRPLFNRLFVSGTLGVSANFRTNGSVMIYNTFANSYVEEQGVDLLGATLDLRTSIRIGYQGRQRLSWLIEPIYQRQLTSFMRPSEISVPVDPRAYYLGVNGGVSLRLFRSK